MFPKQEINNRKNNRDSEIDIENHGSLVSVSLCSNENGNSLFSNNELWKKNQFNLSKLTETWEGIPCDLQYLSQSFYKLSSELPKSCESWGENSFKVMKSIAINLSNTANTISNTVTEPRKLPTLLRHPTAIFSHHHHHNHQHRIINISHPTISLDMVSADG